MQENSCNSGTLRNGKIRAGTAEAYFLDKAHSTYLQMVMGLGWPAAAALYAGLGLLALRSLRARSAVYPAVLASCSVLVGVHALVDFSLEMPANAATYALLLGVGCAQAVQARRGAARGDRRCRRFVPP